MTNRADPDQLASSEGKGGACPGSAGQWLTRLQNYAVHTVKNDAEQMLWLTESSTVPFTSSEALLLALVEWTLWQLWCIEHAVSLVCGILG